MTPEEIRSLLLSPYQHGAHHDLRNIKCEGPLDLTGCAISAVDFSGAHFPQGIDARGAVFQGLSWFRCATFGGAARFDGTQFLSDARFEDAHMEATATFEQTEFRGVGRFDRVAFAQKSSFQSCTCYGNFSLQETAPTTEMNLRDCEWLGGLWCHKAHLPQTTDLSGTEIHGRLWLRCAMLGDRALTTEDFGMSFGYTYL